MIVTGNAADYTVASDGSFTASLELAYPFSRTVGPVVGRFLTSLRSRRIEGTRGSDGRVYVPPAEFDPVTGDPCVEWVEVADTGVIDTSCGVPDGDKAWALVRLDGADVPMLHRIESADALATGARVRVRWAAETVGAITDIECFVPESSPASPAPASTPTGEGEPVQRIRQPVGVSYVWSAGPGSASHLAALIEGRLIGKRCPVCELVYFPPRNGICPRDGVLLGDDVEVSPTGTVTTFCVVNVPFLGQKIEIPYVAATILLDGADIGMQHLIQECPADEVRMGMRVEAVWKPRDGWGPSLENISHFRPTGGPDAELGQV
jgi:uncharacterized OB-fold protein